jgi:hypothetical protein
MDVSRMFGKPDGSRGDDASLAGAAEALVLLEGVKDSFSGSMASVTPADIRPASP